MKILNYTEEAFSDSFSHYGVITDWYDLSAMLGMKTRTFSYVLRNKEAMVKKINIKGRVVYDSKTALKAIQKRLALQFNHMQDNTECDHILSYKTGCDPRQALQGCVDYKYQVTFDIRKFYDHISVDHIKYTLMQYGFNEVGAKLVSRYCTVKRDLPGGKKMSSLQQGSIASPSLSNLVGLFYIDYPILDWLAEQQTKHPKMIYKYHRYCDNMALFLDGEVPLDFIKDYKKFSQELLSTYKFKTHKWSVTPGNHPKKNQSFLGVVLNKQARLEKSRFQFLRAALFNACVKGLTAASAAYCITTDNKPAPKEIRGLPLGDGKIYLGKFASVMRGNIAYLKSINPSHALQLEKLLDAATYLEKSWFGDMVVNRVVGTKTDGSPHTKDNFDGLRFNLGFNDYPKIMDAIKGYSRKDEGTMDYLKGIEQTVNNAYRTKRFSDYKAECSNRPVPANMIRNSFLLDRDVDYIVHCNNDWVTKVLESRMSPELLTDFGVQGVAVEEEESLSAVA